jgi:hypothetical protein
MSASSCGGVKMSKSDPRIPVDPMIVELLKAHAKERRTSPRELVEAAVRFYFSHSAVSAEFRDLALTQARQTAKVQAQIGMIADFIADAHVRDVREER